MAKFIIQGGKPLKGTIEIKGAKNAALPLLASSVLTKSECRFSNVPRILDVLTMLDIMQGLGAEVRWLGESELSICCENISNTVLDYDLVRRLRASVLLVGSLLSRFGEVKIPYPGGCILGKRPLDVHFDTFSMLGAEVTRDNDAFHVKASDLKPARIFMPQASVTATENLLMLASRIEGETIIKNAACEPHVQNLQQALVQMGVRIDGIGCHTIRISGKKELGPAAIKVIPDQLEVGSFAVAALVTKGKLDLVGVDPEHLDPILFKLQKSGAEIEVTDDVLKVAYGQKLTSFDITTNIWPGFPTDLQAPFTVLATQAHGNSMIHDWMYEGRLFYIDKLIAMGADITMCDPHRIIVAGPNELKGKDIESPDIRAGMAMILAALCAEGQSVIDRIELVDRGYLDIEKRLSAVGAEIRRV